MYINENPASNINFKKIQFRYIILRVLLLYFYQIFLLVYKSIIYFVFVLVELNIFKIIGHTTIKIISNNLFNVYM